MLATQETELGIEKRCRKCGEFWPLDFFVRHVSCPSGRSGECTACNQERQKSYR